MMQPHVSTPLLTHDPHSHVSVSELDYFKIVKQEHLPEVEKQKRVEAMWRIALLHFINSDLPLLLPPPDIEYLDQMTQTEQDLNLEAVQNFIRQKITDFDQRINKILGSIKKQLITNHYEEELKLRQLEQTHHHLDRFSEILAVQKILQAVELEDWDLVEATVPLTKSSENS